MQDVALGMIALAAGGFLCFRGQLVLRLVIPFWGALAGFSLGAGLVAGLADQRFLGTVLGWSLGFAFALVFAVLAYLYYAVGVIITMAWIGFVLGATLMVALGVEWSWLIVLSGVAVGSVLALVAILSDLPMLLLIWLSAIGGASAATTGLMLLFGAIDSADFADETVTRRIQDDWWWYAVFVLLALVGALSQTRDADALRRGMRESWD